MGAPPLTIMMARIVLSIALVACASALPALDSDVPETVMMQTMMNKAHKAAKAKVSSMLESGSDSSACAELAKATIDEVVDNVKAQQELVDHFAAPNNGEHCLTEGKEAVDAAESALADAKTEAEEAAAASASAAGDSVDFGSVSLASLTEEDGAGCGPFETDPEYVAAKAAAADAAIKAAAAADAIGGYEEAVATAKEAAAKAVSHCQCVTYTDYNDVYAKATSLAAANAEAYAKGKHMECVLSGTAPADCDVGTTPAVTPITLDAGVTESSCDDVDLDGADWQLVVSDKGTTADDAKAYVSCTGGQIMTGCDCHSWWDDCDGANPKDWNTCSAQAGGGKYVTAQGICASYPEGTGADDWKEVNGPQVKGDDKKSEATCPDGWGLTSCTCLSMWKACDGAKSKGNTCTAYGGKGGDKWSQAKATCVKGDYSYVSIESSKSGKKDDNYAEATCPEGYKLTGCSCHSWWRSCDGAVPQPGNTCRAYESGGGEGVTANARGLKVGHYGPTK